jgi:mono/diheme cytochrome c family protein
VFGSFFTHSTAITPIAGLMPARAFVLAACLVLAGAVTSCGDGATTTSGAAQTSVTGPAGATTSSPSTTSPSTTSPSTATSAGSGSPPTAPATTAPRTGAVLFASYCAGCHGNDGKAKFATTIVGVAPATVKAATEKGTGSMPGFAERLSAADIDAVVTFVGTLK